MTWRDALVMIFGACAGGMGIWLGLRKIFNHQCMVIDAQRELIKRYETAWLDFKLNGRRDNG
jgi:hypothetical protein